MSYLTDFLIEECSKQVIQPKVCHYYCRDDGSGKSVNIFCTLSLGLLLQLVGLQKEFVRWYRKVQESGIYDPAADVEKLQEFFKTIIVSLDRPLLLVIDGLDECDRKSRNNLLDFLQNLSRRTKRLKYVVSTRPRQEILDRLGGTSQIRLSPDIERDRKIARKLVQSELYYLGDELKEMVSEKLSQQAKGSGIWMRMIVNTIAVRDIRAAGPMKRFLAQMALPSELSLLYKNMFDSYTSNQEENKRLGFSALKFLAATRRLLSIAELACAVTLGEAPEPITSVADLEEFIDCQRIMNIIQPFISHIDFNDLGRRQIQLVHQSVKEYILAEVQKEYPAKMVLEQTLNLDDVGKPVEELELAVLNLCIKYLLLDEVAAQSLFSDTQAAIIELPQEVDLFSDQDDPIEYTTDCTWDKWEEDFTRYDPTERGFGDFFAYAAAFWTEHLGCVTVEPLPALSDIEIICKAKSRRLDNWTLQIVVLAVLCWPGMNLTRNSMIPWVLLCCMARTLCSITPSRMPISRASFIYPTRPLLLPIRSSNGVT